jgi:hypothetical protein
MQVRMKVSKGGQPIFEATYEAAEFTENTKTALDQFKRDHPTAALWEPDYQLFFEKASN